MYQKHEEVNQNLVWVGYQISSNVENAQFASGKERSSHISNKSTTLCPLYLDIKQVGSDQFSVTQFNRTRSIISAGLNKTH